MGAGNTIIVEPLRSPMLADDKAFAIQFVPRALVEFSRGIMREKFSTVIRTPVPSNSTVVRQYQGSFNETCESS